MPIPDGNDGGNERNVDGNRGQSTSAEAHCFFDTAT